MSKARDKAKEADAKILAGFKQQMKIDRVITTPFKNHTALKATTAALAILALYIYGWGDGIITAFQVLYGREMSPRDLTPEIIPVLTEQLIQRAIIITGAVILFLWLRTKPTTRKTFRSGIRNLAVAFIVVNAGLALMTIFGLFLENFGVQANDYPRPEAIDGLATFLYIFSSATAGPAEEILMLALVVILMRKLNIGWTPIMIVAILLRLPFHMYYGWAAIAMTFWVIASVLFYKFTNRIWPLVLAHAAKNTLAGIYALRLDPYEITALLTIAFMIYGLVVVKNHLVNLANTATPGKIPSKQQTTR